MWAGCEGHRRHDDKDRLWATRGWPAMTYSDSARLKRPLAGTSSDPWPRGCPPATTSSDPVASGESFGDDLLRFVFMPFMIMFYVYYYTIHSFHWGFYDDKYDVSHVAWFFYGNHLNSRMLVSCYEDVTCDITLTIVTTLRFLRIPMSLFMLKSEDFYTQIWGAPTSVPHAIFFAYTIKRKSHDLQCL